MAKKESKAIEYKMMSFPELLEAWGDMLHRGDPDEDMQELFAELGRRGYHVQAEYFCDGAGCMEDECRCSPFAIPERRGDDETLH